MDTYPMAQSYYYDQRQYPDMSYYSMPHHHQHHHQQQQQPHGLPIMNMHQMATTNAFRGTMNMTSAPAPSTSTPSASNTTTNNQTNTATTAGQKPTIIVQPGSLMPLDTRFVSTDYYGFPSTPPLSASGSSVISSPPASGTQHTFSDSFLAFDKVEGVKEGCEGDVHAEILANPEWSRSDSPPMTPVFIHPPSLTASQTSDLLSTNSSCPSLSPSPSPVSSSFDPHTAILSQSSHPSASASAAAAAAAAATLSVEPAGAHFCDPRELTVESSLGAADLPPLPTLSEETKLDTPVALQDNVVPEQPVAEDALSALPTFDSFSDLDSEDEFVNLVDFPPSQNAFFLGDKRQRVAYPEEDGFLSEPADEVDEHTGFSFEPSAVPTVPGAAAAAAAAAAPAATTSAPAPQHTEKEKKRKTLKRSSTVESDCSSHAHHAHTHHHHSHAEARDEPRQVSEVSESGAPVSVNRRGRKQSLTDDPSKTFVCTLCSRRFRRQEHLKRHYRSLHTQDKPFECTECGKKFSRSDNLAQHARTHGGQSMMMGVLENSVAYDEDQVSPAAATPATAGLGAVLYDVEDGASRSNKKRKRDDQ